MGEMDLCVFGSAGRFALANDLEHLMGSPMDSSLLVPTVVSYET